MWGIVARFEKRVAAGTAARSLWHAALAAMRTVEGRPQALRLSVLANALALVHFDDDEDVQDLARLGAELGRSTTAALQDELLGPVDPALGRPVLTRLVRVLGERAWGAASRTPGALTAEVEALRELCGEVALRLLMIDDGDDGAPPRMRTATDVLRMFHEGDVSLWRRLVTAALADPWAGRTEFFLGLIDPVRHPGEHAGVAALSDLARRIAEEDERRAVADHIRTTIAATGLTQREFATLVGTSPSRLSTYVTGSVTPSAAMLLRINRMAKRARNAGPGLPEENG